MSLAERDALLSRLLGQEWPHEPMLSALNIPRHADVLDVGAGEGRLLHFLISQGHTGQLKGIDPQPGERVEWGEAEVLPFPAQFFAVVLMLRMLTHCHGPVQALREAKRVLLPEGQLVVAVQGKHHLKSLMNRPEEAVGPEDEIQKLLHTIGLNFTRRDLLFRISLSQPDATAVLESYGKSRHWPQTAFPMLDTLHLTLFQA